MTQALRGREYALDFLRPWNDHDVQAILDSLPDHFTWQFTVGTEPHGTVYKGKVQLEEQLESIFQAIPDLHYEIVDIPAARDFMVMELLVTGHNRKTDTVLHYQACDIVLFDGDVLREKRSYRKVISAK